MLIVTDTLATTVDGEAMMFQSKAWALPHLNMAIAVTGVANLGAEWDEFLRSSAVVLDLRMIDRFAPEHLRRLWLALQDGAPHDSRITATIYHFGFEHGSDRAVRYAYRSTNNLSSERIEKAGFGVKPTANGFVPTPPESLDDIITMALQIRADQDALPASERIFIGGELQMMLVRDGETQTRRIYRFPDYDDAWRAMMNRPIREEPTEGEPLVN